MFESINEIVKNLNGLFKTLFKGYFLNKILTVFIQIFIIFFSLRGIFYFLILRILLKPLKLILRLFFKQNIIFLLI